MAISREGQTYLQCFEARGRVQVGILNCSSFIILQTNMCSIFSVSQQELPLHVEGGRAHHKNKMRLLQVIYYVESFDSIQRRLHEGSDTKEPPIGTNEEPSALAPILNFQFAP